MTAKRPRPPATIEKDKARNRAKYKLLKETDPEGYRLWQERTKKANETRLTDPKRHARRLAWEKDYRKRRRAADPHFYKDTIHKKNWRKNNP